MFLKKFDRISPKITLYFKGNSSHISIYSGILAIISYIIVIIAAIYYILDFIHRKNPKAYFFSRYVEDVGTFPLNSTQMFHFIQVTNPYNNQKIPLDFQAFRIIGFDDVYADDYMNNGDIVKTKNHWIYGNCNNDSDTKGISFLINHNYYQQSACIRKYYDADKKKYFNTREEGFRWPSLDKGCSNPERTYYGIIMQRCDKASEFIKNQGPICKSTEEIDGVIKNSSLSFQIIDNYVDMLNYKMPLTKYFYELATGFLDNHYNIQNLNFNPVSIVTYNGIFFDNNVKEGAYFFTQNEKQTLNELDLIKEGKSINGCLIAIYFWMQNNLQYYERHYDRIQDILSVIGGISNIVLTSVSIINLLVHNFIVILDTEELSINSQKEIYKNNRENLKKPTISIKGNNVIFPPKKLSQSRKNYENENQLQSSNSKKIIKSAGFGSEKLTSLEKNINQKYFYSKNNTMLNYEMSIQDKNSLIENLHNSRSLLKKRLNKNNLYEDYNPKGPNNQIKKMSIAIKDKGITESKKEKENKSKALERQNFNWFKYIGYLICCGRTDKKIVYYENFRAKLISEENIVQNYIDIYKLLRIVSIENSVFN